jgi:leader peptidase (prepilin peptidase)/N-methyltransferase
MQLLFDQPGLLLLASPFVGSFLGVLVQRLPDSRPVLFARSACAVCEHRLQLADLLPLVSWLALRGRCRYCDAKLSRFYPAVELAALAIAAWSAAMLPGWLAWAGCGLGWTLLALALIDLRHYVLPTELTLPLGLAGLVVAWRIEPATLPGHLLGAALGLIGLLAVQSAYRRLRNRDGLGTGDAILLAAIGAWTGWQGVPSVLLYAAASGLCFTMIRTIGGERVALDSRIAFGPHLCLGAWLVWLHGPLQFG